MQRVLSSNTSPPTGSTITSAPPPVISLTASRKTRRRQRRVDYIVRRHRRELLRRARCGDHPRAERLGQIDRGQPDAAGRAVDQYPLARLELGAAYQRDISGVVGRADARAGGEIEIGGKPPYAGRVDGDQFGEPAEPRPRNHCLARHESAIAIGVHHLARDFHAGNERQIGLQLIFALGHQQVGEIERRRAYPDQHLPWRPHRIGQVGQRAAGEIGTEFRNDQRFHRLALPRGQARVNR
jgi:hypothetical protein